MQIAARSVAASSSHPRSRKELFKVSDAALQSNICWGRWSSSSAVSSNSLTPQQGQKRVPKQERRAMIVAFVEKYRALNAGKFPTASRAKKRVGGSYYVIREIIQELEYNHKRSSPETGKEVKFTTQENAKCEDFPSTEEPFILADDKQTVFKEYTAHVSGVKKHSSKKIKLGNETSSMSVGACSDHPIDMDSPRQITPSRDTNRSWKNKDPGLENRHVPSSPSTSTRAKPQTDTPLETLNVEKVGSQVSTKLKREKGTLRTPAEVAEIGGEDLGSAANLQDACSPERNQISNREVLRSEELNSAQGQKDEQVKAFNFWGSLKSMAAGIFNLWKKT